MIASNSKLKALFDEAEAMATKPGFVRKEIKAQTTEFGEITLSASYSFCQVCGKHSQPYMVTDEIWRESGFSEGFACARCLQVALGRSLTLEDFADLPVNEIILLLKENAQNNYEQPNR